MSLEAIPSTSDRVIFVWIKGQKVIYIVACFVDDTLWGRNQEFACIINQLNPFVPNTPFLYPLKTSENRKIFGCFQGIEKRCIGNKWVKRTFKTGVPGPESMNQHHRIYPTQPRTIATSPSPTFHRRNHLLRRTLVKLNWVAGITLHLKLVSMSSR